MADLKCRNFLGVIYPDSESYSCESVLLALDSTFTEWSYILHDRDTDENGELKKPHIHWVGKRKTPVPISTISNALGVPSNSIEFCKKYKAAIQYLVHRNDFDKTQYEVNEVVANFEFQKYLVDMNDLQQAIKVMNYVKSERPSRFVDLMQWCMENGCWSEFRRSSGCWAIALNEIKNA